MVLRRRSDGLKLETRNAQAPPRTSSVVARRAQASRRARRWSATSLIDPAPRPPRDAQHVGEHPWRVMRETNRGVLVVHQPERLLADLIAGLASPQEDLRFEGEARHLQLGEEVLGDGGAVTLVAALDVRVRETEEPVDGPRVDHTRQLAHRRNLDGRDRLGMQP